MKAILGVNYSGLHDSAVAVVEHNGTVRYAMAEERPSRSKKESRFPHRSIAEVNLETISHIALPGLLTQKENIPRDELFADVLMPGHRALETFPEGWNRPLENLKKPIVMVDHHDAHAAAGFFLSGLTEALVFTADYGAFNCPWNMGFYHATSAGLRPLHRASNQYFEPLCSLYSDVTAILGFKPNMHEGKVTGLASYTKDSPDCEAALWELHKEIRAHPLPLYEWIGWRDERFSASLEVNGGMVKAYRERLAAFSDQQIARAVQSICERKVTELVKKALVSCPCDAIVLSGGLFANVKINLEVKRIGFKQLFVCPPMGDDGLAIGSAALARAEVYNTGLVGPGLKHLYLGTPPFHRPVESDSSSSRTPQNTALRGTNTSEPTQLFDRLGIVTSQPKDISAEVANLLAQGKTIARVTGAMEFGPRALGHRSLLFNASDPTVNQWLNHKLRRNEFMPFAPMMRAEIAAKFFDAAELSGCEHTAQFMTVCLHCTAEFKKLCPAVVHVDGTARPQLVTKDSEPELYAILEQYEKLTGLPAIINTSFNVHDEPIVGDAIDAIIAFFQSDLDVLVLDQFIISAAENPRAVALINLAGDRIAAERKQLYRATTQRLSEQLNFYQYSHNWSESERVKWIKEYDVCFGLLKEFQKLNSGESWAETERKKWIAEYEKCHDQLVSVQKWAAELNVAKEFLEGQVRSLQSLMPDSAKGHIPEHVATSPIQPPPTTSVGEPKAEDDAARRQHEERAKLEAEVARFFDRSEPPRASGRR